MKCNPKTCGLCAGFLLLLASLNLHSQLVADGDTLNLTVSTNLPGDLIVGTNGSNTFLNIVAPGAVTNGNGVIGFSASSYNNMVMVQNSGAFWINSSNLVIGSEGSANSLVVSNGAVVICEAGGVGASATASNNLAVVSGVGSVWTNSEFLVVGDEGSGNNLIVSDGANAFCDLGGVGFDSASSNNAVLITGPGSLWISPTLFFVGFWGSSNTVAVTDAGAVTTADLYVGAVDGANNLLHVDGGSLTAVTNLDVRRGTLQLDSGTVAAGNLIATNATLDGGGFINFNGGALSVGGSTVANGSPLVVGSGSSVAMLQLTSNGVHAFNDGLIISKFAQLTGSGTVIGPVTLLPGASVTPGNPIGRLVFSNSPSLQGGLTLQINKTGVTPTNDQIRVSAPLTYGGSLFVNPIAGDPFTAGDSFALFEATSYAGAFANMTLPLLAPGLMWTNRLLIDGSLAVIPATPTVVTPSTESGTNLVLAIAGGSAAGTYELYSSTNAAAPFNSWTRIRLASLDWMGNATVTNTINFSEPERYFRVITSTSSID